MRHGASYLLACLLVAFAGPAAADVSFYVRGDGAGSDSYAGTSWATAWATLQKAMSSVPLQSGAYPANSTGPAHIYVQASSGSQTYSVASRSLGYYGGPGSGMDADTSYVAVASSPDFTLSGDYTVAAWIRSDNIGNQWEAFMGNYNGGSAGFIYALRDNAANELSIWAGGTWNYSGTTIPDNEWTYVAYTRQGTTGRFLVNGVNVTSNAGATAGTTGAGFELGGAGTSWAGNRFDGSVDEGRLSACTRSTNWIWAEYLNMASNSVFNAYAPVLNLSRPTVFIFR